MAILIMVKAMPTLEEMIAKGKSKLAGKVDTMRENYRAAIETAIEGYQALPFGPKTKAAYVNAMRTYAAKNYEAKVTPEIAEKWARKWRIGVSR